jgi:hypothetical protein
MTGGLIWTVVVVALVAFVACGVLAAALRGAAERWAIIGAILSAVSIVVAIAIARYQHPDNTSYSPSSEATPSRPYASPSPGVTSLPAGSPLRKQILDMDQVCGHLGLSQHAWLPGQASVDDLSGRVILGSNAAYTWSCTENGPKLTRDNITQGCKIWYPGTTAYTLDPNDAYSWIYI